MHAENPYPRASVTTRLARASDLSKYYGPFPSRVAAEKFMNDSLDFFKMRRCVDDLNPDPKFPGCIYSEMKMCLAPCFKGCTDEEYAGEVARVKAYFESGGDTLVREISAQRETASANLEFENAAAHHARFEKLAPVVSSLPEIVRRLDQLRALIVQTSAVQECVSLFRVDAGCVAGPATFPISAPDHTKTQSMEARVDEALASLPPATPRGALEAMEHLAILKRWFYRSSRGGEIFITDRKGVLPMRRVVRGISRVYRGEKENP
jgi:excinuclease UvrABC nuclease subunit